MKFLVSIGYFRVELMRQLQERLGPLNRPWRVIIGQVYQDVADFHDFRDRGTRVNLQDALSLESEDWNSLET